MEKIYAKILNPEWYDYEIYDIREDDGNDLIIDGGREWADVDNNGYLSAIKKLINNYDDWDLDYYYHGKIGNLIRDYLPKKENGKDLSPKEIHNIKKALDNGQEEAICECLHVITGKTYTTRTLRGSMQREWVKAYYPEDEEEYASWVEAWYFGTGTEILIHQEDNEPETADDIDGYSMYTDKWKDEDIKNEIKKECGYKESDEVEVILWKYDHTVTTKRDVYVRAE